MSEILDVLDEFGNITGITKERNEIHKSGDWHSSIHLWLKNDDELLLQKRSVQKESYPGCFDATVAGHVSFGESIQEAAIRECNEEIGILLEETQMRKVGVRRLIIENPGFISREFNYIFCTDVDKNMKFNIDELEIERLEWKRISDIKKELKYRNPQYCITLEELDMICNS